MQYLKCRSAKALRLKCALPGNNLYFYFPTGKDSSGFKLEKLGIEKEEESVSKERD